MLLFTFLHRGLTLRLSNFQGGTTGRWQGVSQVQSVWESRAPFTPRLTVPSCPSSVGWNLGQVWHRPLKPQRGTAPHGVDDQG